MKEIKLTKGATALIDDDDYQYINQWKWNYNGSYAMRTKGKTCVYMHREIAKTPKGKHTDHINRNKLDNRSNNLRVCDHSTNMLNRPATKRNTSGYKGISWNRKKSKWQVYVSTKYIGIFSDLNEAIKANEAHRV